MAFDTTDILLILVVVVLLFGATQIPKIARAVGRAQGEFSRAKKEVQAEVDKGRSEAGVSKEEEERRIRAAAADLGIEAEGKDLDELKRLINERVG